MNLKLVKHVCIIVICVIILSVTYRVIDTSLQKNLPPYEVSDILHKEKNSIVPAQDIKITNQLQGKVQPKEISLGAPSGIVSDKNSVDIRLPSRVCEQRYAVERSYDGANWESAGVAIFVKYENLRDTGFRECESDYIDNGVKQGVVKVFYRYGLFDHYGKVLVWSSIGEVNIGQIYVGE